MRDENLAFEMFKKGDLDYSLVNVSRQWVQELNFDRVAARPDSEAQDLQRQPDRHSGRRVQHAQGAVRRRPRPQGARAPVLNRELLIEKLFFNEYVPLNSYYAGGIYENPNNPKNRVRSRSTR